MRLTLASPSLYRVGSFELDLQAGELHTNGFKIRLQEQPLEILAMLVDRPGEMVTREELRLKLWPADTFVDFEHGLNRAINKLREALGDDAAKPRYIETLPRRGYRLIAPVENVGPAYTPGNGDSAAPSAVAEAPPRLRAEVPANIHPQLPQARQESAAKLRYKLLLAVAGVVVAGTALTYLVTPPSAPKVLGYTQLTHDGRMKEGMVTDGTRLYFNATFSGQSVICQVSTSGGEIVPLASTLPNATLADISPKGDELLVVTNLRKTGGHGVLWVLPLVGGSPRRVGEAYAGGFYLAASAAWSPDGMRVAYIGDALYIAESDGTHPRKVALPDGTPFRIRWSPDGRMLRFNVDHPKKAVTIWEVLSDGSNLHSLLPEGTKPNWGSCCGNWTRDGKYFVFTDFSNLWALREERGWLRRTGSEPVQLTHGPLLFSNPVPSKDGKKLFAVGELDRGQLVRYDTKTQGVIPYLSGIWAEGVSFSRDGKWVAYVTQPESALWRSKIDGSESLRLTFPPTVPSQPRWSPDGRRIAFVAPSPEGALKIHLISADGGSLEEPLPEGMQASQASWSSDGESLAFNCYGPPLDRSGIHLLNLKTRQVSTLPGSEGLMHPRFSPDGRFITAQPLDLNGPLALYDVKARKRSDLAGSKSGTNAGSWSRDSRYIYVRTDTERGPVVNRVRISDRKVEKVADLEGLQLVDGTWMGLAPDDSPLFVRDVGSYEIYALDWEAP